MSKGRLSVGLVALGLAAVFLAARAWSIRREDSPIQPSRFLPPERLAAEVARLDSVVKGNPDDLGSLVALGTLRYQQGKDHYIEGINALEKARELGAMDARMFYYLGAMYQELGLYPFALAQYRRFLRNFPGNQEARLRAAKLEYQAGGYAQAVQDYQALAVGAPLDPVVQENLALSLLASGRVQEAEKTLESLARQGGEIGCRAHFFLGRIAAENKEYRLAAAQLEKAATAGRLAAGVDAREFYGLLGAAYDGLGLSGQAESAWKNLLALDPSNRAARRRVRILSRRLPRRPAGTPREAASAAPAAG